MAQSTGSIDEAPELDLEVLVGSPFSRQGTILVRKEAAALQRKADEAKAVLEAREAVHLAQKLMTPTPEVSETGSLHESSYGSSSDLNMSVTSSKSSTFHFKLPALKMPSTPPALKKLLKHKTTDEKIKEGFEDLLPEGTILTSEQLLSLTSEVKALTAASPKLKLDSAIKIVMAQKANEALVHQNTKKPFVAVDETHTLEAPIKEYAETVVRRGKESGFLYDDDQAELLTRAVKIKNPSNSHYKDSKDTAKTMVKETLADAFVHWLTKLFVGVAVTVADAAADGAENAVDGLVHQGLREIGLEKDRNENDAPQPIDTVVKAPTIKHTSVNGCGNEQVVKSALTALAGTTRLITATVTKVAVTGAQAAEAAKDASKAGAAVLADAKAKLATAEEEAHDAAILAKLVELGFSTSSDLELSVT